MAKTIHTILYDDVLDGSKIITMDNCVCQLFDIKRDFDTLIRNTRCLTLCEREIRITIMYTWYSRMGQKPSLDPNNNSSSGSKSLSRKIGDLNGDGNINVADHVKLTNIIMNK